MKAGCLQAAIVLNCHMFSTIIINMNIIMIIIFHHSSNHILLLVFGIVVAVAVIVGYSYLLSINFKCKVLACAILYSFPCF